MIKQMNNFHFRHTETIFCKKKKKPTKPKKKQKRKKKKNKLINS